MRKLKNIIGIVLLTLTVSAQELLYYEDFEAGTKPADWGNWNYLQANYSSWSNSATVISGTYSLLLTNSLPSLTHTKGVFYGTDNFQSEPFPFGALTNIIVEFLYQVNVRPPADLIEVIDLYDDDYNECCNIYYHDDGKLSLFLNNGNSKCATPIPTNVPVQIKLQYIVNEGKPSFGQFEWTTNGTYLGYGSKFVSLTNGYFHTPIYYTLFGPVSYSGMSVIYDDFSISRPACLEPW